MAEGSGEHCWAGLLPIVIVPQTAPLSLNRRQHRRQHRRQEGAAARQQGAIITACHGGNWVTIPRLPTSWEGEGGSSSGWRLGLARCHRGSWLTPIVARGFSKSLSLRLVPFNDRSRQWSYQLADSPTRRLARSPQQDMPTNETAWLNHLNTKKETRVSTPTRNIPPSAPYHNPGVRCKPAFPHRFPTPKPELCYQ